MKIRRRPSIKSKITADISLLLVALIWGSTFGLTKSALREVSPMYFLAIRFIAAFIALLPVIVWRVHTGRKSRVSYKNRFIKSVKPGIILGLMFTTGYIAQTEGLRYTSATVSGFITGLNVIFVAITYAVINRSLPNRRSRFGVILATVGLLFITLSPSLTFAKGDLITLICALFFGLHIVVTERYVHEVEPVGVVTIQALVISVLTLVISFAQGDVIPVNELPLSVLASAAFCGIFATSVALVVQTVAQRVASSIETAIAYSMEPVFAAMFASLFFGEILGVRTVVGGIMILTGIVVVNLNMISPPESIERHKANS